jgi:hypothetical protein
MCLFAGKERNGSQQGETDDQYRPGGGQFRCPSGLRHLARLGDDVTVLQQAGGLFAERPVAERSVRG